MLEKFAKQLKLGVIKKIGVARLPIVFVLTQINEWISSQNAPKNDGNLESLSSLPGDSLSIAEKLEKYGS